MDEFRKRERHDLEKHILCYQCADQNPSYRTKVPFVFHVHDISYGGLGIYTDQRMHPGSVLTFKLDIPTQHIAREFQVVVRWCKYEGDRYSSGVAFKDVVKEDIIFLFQIVKPLEH